MSWLAQLRGGAVTTRRALGLLWSVSRGRTAVIAGLTLVDALLPAAVAWVAKLIVDAVVAGSVRDTLIWVGLEAALVIGRSVLYHLDDFARSQLGMRLSIHVNSQILDKTLGMALRHFEDAEFNDQLARAAKEAGTRPLHVIEHTLRVARDGIRLVSFAALLAAFSPWVVLGILAGTAPQLLSQAGAATLSFAVQQRRTLSERRADYLREVLLREPFAKEVKLFALGRMLRDRWRTAQEEFFAEDVAVLRRTMARNFATRVLATVAFYGCYVAIAWAAAKGTITVGDLTMLMLVVKGSQDSFESALSSAAKVYEGNLYMDNLFDFLALEEDEPFEPLDGHDGRRGAPPELVLEHVDFTYPGLDAPALRDVSFTVRPGETLALVGPNGAGKTTLIKLLVKLYEPTAGAIRLDGDPLATLSPASVRRRIGVIFQDFIQFHLTAAENVGVGWVPAMEDGARVAAAAEEGGASGFLSALPDGLDTMLGRYYGGSQLSIGQWQRVALARAFMRSSELLILDEPTAAMDAEAEAALFAQLNTLKRGRTAILITHRFGTVRFADRIVVLDGGRLVEEGTHAELMGRDGLYARMFRAQAEGYLLPEEPAPLST